MSVKRCFDDYTGRSYRDVRRTTLVLREYLLNDVYTYNVFSSWQIHRDCDGDLCTNLVLQLLLSLCFVPCCPSRSGAVSSTSLPRLESGRRQPARALRTAVGAPIELQHRQRTT